MQEYGLILSKKVIDSEGFNSLLNRVTEAKGYYDIVCGGWVFIYLPSGCKLDPYQEIDEICQKPLPEIKEINRMITTCFVTGSIQNLADSPSEQVKLVRVGCVPIGFGTPDAYVTIDIDGVPVMRVDIYSDIDYYAFKGVLSVTVLDLGRSIGDNQSPIDLRFYTGNKFPAAYCGAMFVALHDSSPTARKERLPSSVVRVVFKDDKPAGVEDFVTGWMKDGQVLGRPAGLITGADGELYISNDNKGFIYRVSFGEK